jgi:hypothetical protein
MAAAAIDDGRGRALIARLRHFFAGPRQARADHPGTAHRADFR